MKILFTTLIACTLTSSLHGHNCGPRVPVDYHGNTNTNPTTTLESKGAKWEQQAQECQVSGYEYTAGNRYEYAAEFYKTAGNTTKAIELYNKAATSFEAAFKLEGLRPIVDNPNLYDYIRTANDYREAGNNDKAIEFFILAAEASEQHAEDPRYKDARTRAWFYNIAADSYKNAGNTAKADELYALAASIFKIDWVFQIDKDCDRVYNSYGELANDYREAGNNDKANEMLERMALVCEQEAVAWEEATAIGYYNLAIKAYKQAGNTVKANNVQSKLNILQKEL